MRGRWLSEAEDAIVARVPSRGESPVKCQTRYGCDSNGWSGSPQSSQFRGLQPRKRHRETLTDLKGFATLSRLLDEALDVPPEKREQWLESLPPEAAPYQ